MARKPIRRDEVFAQEALTRYLHSRGVSHLLWEEPDQDPPDFFLTVDGQRHAVEVTQVMDSVELGGRVISDRGVVSALRQTVATLEEAAKKRKVLRGFYHLHVCPLPNLRRALPEIESRLFRYLIATGEMQAAEPVILWRGGGGQRWTVAKVHNGGSVLTESMSLGVAKWQGEVREELMHLLAARIATKTLKSATIPGPKLLLLVDAYNYGDADDWEDVARLVSAGPFHTVARVYQEYACQVLTSMAGGWR